MIYFLKKSRYVLFLLLFIFSTIFSSIAFSVSATEKDKWSVFIYMCGTDLESGSEQSNGTDNLNELLSLKIPENVNIIVTTGGTKSWDIEGINPKKLQRFKIESGELKLLEEKTLENMGESETLSDFLTWGVKNFPAEKNMVLLWNHGSGSVNGVMADEIYDLDTLMLNELGNAFKTTNFKFDIIGFDTCLTANLEVASQIQPYGSYMVASQEFEPAPGWNYTKWAGAIAENPEITPEELGKIICDSFFEKVSQLSETFDESVTLSVINLEKLPKLEKSFNAMALELSKATTDIHKFREIYAALEKTESYGAISLMEGNSSMRDLSHFAKNVEPIIGKAATEVYNNVKEVVAYSLKGNLHPNSSGISFYCNFSDTQDNYNKYATGSKSAEYLAFLDVVSHVWTAPDWVYEKTNKVKSLNFNDYVLQYSTEIKEGNIYRIKFENAKDSMYKLNTRLFKSQEDGGSIVYNIGADTYVDEESSSVDVVFSTSTLMMEGIPVFTEIISQTDDYVMFAIPIVLNGNETSLRVKYDIKNKKYEILGAWQGLIYDTTVSSRVLQQLKDGDVVEPLLPNLYSQYGSEVSYDPVGSFTVSGDVKFSKGSLPDGDYIFDCVIVNVFGRRIPTDGVVVKINEGKVSLFEFREVLFEEQYQAEQASQV